MSVGDRDREPFFAELAPDRSHWRVRWRLAAAGAPPLRVLPGAWPAERVEAFLDAYGHGFEDGHAAGQAHGKRALRRDLCTLLGAAMVTEVEPD